MKEEHVVLLVRVRMEQAFETLEDARTLLTANRSPRSVINRAYYSMFYAALALLQTIGQAPSKHTGVISLFDAEFYQKGLFAKEMSKAFHEIFELRQFSDYRSFQPVSADQAQDALGKAELFLSTVRVYLNQHGYLE